MLLKPVCAGGGEWVRSLIKLFEVSILDFQVNPVLMK